MRKGFTLIELTIVLMIIGILITISASAWTALVSYLHQIRYEERLKQYKHDFLEHSKDFDELYSYFKVSPLKRDYPQAYIIYSQAYMKTYPNPCSYSYKASKNVDEKFFDLYYLGKKIKNVLYVVVLDGHRKVEDDFSFLDDHTLKVKDPKLKFFYVTLDTLKMKICPKFSESNYFLDCIKKESSILPYDEADLIPIYPIKYTYLKYSTYEGLFNFDKNQKSIKVSLNSPINEISFLLYDKNFNLVDKRNEFIGYLNEELLKKKLPLNITCLNNSLYKISWKVDNLTKYSCLIDFGDGKNMYLPNCQKFSYVLHRYPYEGNFKFKLLVTNSKIIYYNDTIIYSNTDNLQPDINFVKEGNSIKFFILDNAEDKDKCYLYLNSKLFLKTDNCGKLFLNLFKSEYPCSIKLFVEDKRGATNTFCDILKQN